ncbi:hypothetical protein GTO91_16745 [Heliobacterium undosum]|uniref:Uncharacterized protein n=1 Tax=Heliomicrobium undosum TaxID=121734 RepID=A0A845L9P4_9FIRM|nr:hypothetical protein [Heliomicrobium undosum]MZP31350.1 hypothetical protein [Heliomicrobium undosum]
MDEKLIQIITELNSIRKHQERIESLILELIGNNNTINSINRYNHTNRINLSPSIPIFDSPNNFIAFDSNLPKQAIFEDKFNICISKISKIDFTNYTIQQVRFFVLKYKKKEKYRAVVQRYDYKYFDYNKEDDFINKIYEKFLADKTLKPSYQSIYSWSDPELGSVLNQVFNYYPNWIRLINRPLGLYGLVKYLERQSFEPSYVLDYFLKHTKEITEDVFSELYNS